MGRVLSADEAVIGMDVAANCRQALEKRVPCGKLYSCLRLQDASRSFRLRAESQCNGLPFASFTIQLEHSMEED